MSVTFRKNQIFLSHFSARFRRFYEVKIFDCGSPDCGCCFSRAPRNCMFACLTPVHPSPHRRCLCVVSQSFLPSLKRYINRPPSTPLSRVMGPQSRGVGHFLEKSNIFQSLFCTFQTILRGKNFRLRVTRLRVLLFKGSSKLYVCVPLTGPPITLSPIS